ncbi:MAG: hypothetical protein L0Z50_33480 [Verrucomicrobiales bacterium]|nr:hypothetical protein [Verrucomicrobiales bacterium]
MLRLTEPRSGPFGKFAPFATILADTDRAQTIPRRDYSRVLAEVRGHTGKTAGLTVI